jgi:ParB family chromosome partitioning protein
VNAAERQPKRALGRGLSALIPQAAPAAAPTEAPAKGVLKLPIEAISRDLSQPRRVFDEEKLKELAASIRAQGLIQPVLVRREGDGYRLIAGERRWRAAQLAGLKEIPALVREATEAEAFELALVENLQRADLNPIEEAEGYRRLVEEFALTQEQVSQKVGKDRSTVANALRLLQLPDEVKSLVASGAINMGHARALLGVPRIPEMVELAERIAAQKLSVRDTERLVKQAKAPTPAQPPKKQAPEARKVVEELQRALGTKVRLSDQGGKGTLEIDFFSYADLDRILALLRR